MNPLTNVKNITKLNETELATGSIHKKSWHDMYKDSAWIFIGGLEYGLTEGDVIAVFSQYGEIENINLVRDKKTGKSKGFCFLCYSNQKSTILAVDNLNGIKLCNRTIRVDHVANYKPPKENERDDELTKVLKSEGCAPQVIQNLATNTKETSEAKNVGTSESKSKKKSKKEKKEKKKKKKKHKSVCSDSDNVTHTSEVKVKKEKHDPGYDKYDTTSHKMHAAANERYEKRTGFSNGECSYSNRNDSLRLSNKYFKTEKNDDFNRYKSKIKTEPESDREYFRTDRNSVVGKNTSNTKSRTDYRNESDSDIHRSLPKKHKRKRSSSSSFDDDRTNDDRTKRRHKNERVESDKYYKQKKKLREIEYSSSSSRDDGSSTQSSSEDEKYDDRHSKKDNYRTYENKTNQEADRDRKYPRYGDSYTSSKSKHYDDDKYAEHKSRTNYKDNDRDDAYYKNSNYHKRKNGR